MRKARALLLAALMLFPLSAPVSAGGASRFEGLYPTAAGSALMQVDAGPGGSEIVSLAVSGTLALALRASPQGAGEQALTLINLGTNRILAHRALGEAAGGNPVDAGFLGDGRVYALNRSGWALTVFDGQLAPHAQYGPYDSEDAWDALVEKGGGTLWLAGGKGASVLRLSLMDGQKERMDSGLPEGWVFHSFLGEADGAVWCAFENDRGYQVAGVTDGYGPMRLLPLPMGFFGQQGGFLLASRGTHALASALPETRRFLRLEGWRNQEFALGGGDGFLLSVCPGSEAPLRVYDLRNAVLAGELALPGWSPHTLFGAAAVSGEGFALLSTVNMETGVSVLYLWDFAAQTAAPKALQTVTLEEVRLENDRRAAAIGDRFGMSVHIRQAGAGFENDAYSGAAMEDEPGIAHALDQAEAFLSRLPEGMARETLTPPYERLSLYLCGAILPKGGDGLVSAVGFSSEQGTERYIAMDARNCDMEQDLAHEFMHLVEDRLWLMEGDETGSPMSRWVRLSSPDTENRGYAYSYHAADGTELQDPAYTASDPLAASDPGRVWFVDAYSRTFPLEDRARIFEHLFTWDAAKPNLFVSPRLAAKAQVLSAAIRNAFASVRATAVAPWERAIAVLPYGQAMKLLDEARDGGAE